jgi:hypothetical protein
MMAEMIKRGKILRVDVYPAAMGEQGWRARAKDDNGNQAIYPIEAGSLAEAIEATIDFLFDDVKRDDFGVDTRAGWAIWERAEDGYKSTLTTKDGLTVYDLDPQASELWAVAGPAGFSKSDLDPDNLPDGFRWVTAEEWQELVKDVD